MEAVRAAAAEDEPRLRALAGEMLAGLLDQRGGRLLLASDPTARGGTGLADRVAGWVGSAGSAGRLVLVGTLEGAVTGFACGHVDDPEGGGRRGVLDACYVEPAARGVGIGRLLVDSVVSWFEDRGVEGVDGIALPGDRQAKNFFESAGFKARMLTMHRSLG
ncbi:MAG: GNAT family N-acetyltransferase [Acidimicrobiales bacterium]